MASTSAPARRGAPSSRGPDRPSHPVPAPRRQRRWSLALVSILVTVGSALGFALLWINAGGRQPMLAVAQTVPAGQVIEAADLSVVRVSADPGLRPVGVDRRAEVIGQTAVTDLVAGALLTDGQWGSGSLLAEGDVVVGVPIRREQLPQGQLQPGDQVLVVLNSPASTATDSGGSDRTAGGVSPGSLGQVLAEARVFDSDELATAATTAVVSLAVPLEAAPDVAGASATGRVSLVLVPDR